jgi:hypothetical protein
LADDNPSIGLIKCKQKNRTIAEYALRDTRKPMGVATYTLHGPLPAELRKQLPSIERIEAKMAEAEKRRTR